MYIQFVTVTVKRVIPTVQFGNDQPELTMTAELAENEAPREVIDRLLQLASAELEVYEKRLKQRTD